MAGSSLRLCALGYGLHVGENAGWRERGPDHGAPLTALPADYSSKIVPTNATFCAGFR